MPEITAIFWDVGGVLLSNAWDRVQRQRAVQRFQLDPLDFEDRHQMLVSSFERGKITLKEYLERTVFYRRREFSPDQFREFMFSLSQPCGENLALAHSLAGSGKYLMSTINNESAELNRYRIEYCGLGEIFDLFVSSCFVGLRKPEEAIYRLALDITQKRAQECCFIDDRALNLEAAALQGMKTIQAQNPEQLRHELELLGVRA